MTTTIENKLKEIIATVFEIDAEKINTDFAAKNVEKWDSMNHMNLIVAVEEEFDMEIDEDDILDLMSFKAFAEYLNKSNN